MKPPNNERPVLTWIRDSEGNECWQIDSYSVNKITKFGFWFEAIGWDQKVLYWEDLRPAPAYEEEE